MIGHTSWAPPPPPRFCPFPREFSLSFLHQTHRHCILGDLCGYLDSKRKAYTIYPPPSPLPSGLSSQLPSLSPSPIRIGVLSVVVCSVPLIHLHHLQYQRFPILSPHFSPPSLHLFPPPPHSPRTNRLNIVPSSTLSFFLSFFPPNTSRASSSSPSPSISSDGGEYPIHIRIHFSFILLLLLLPPALVAGILKGLDPFFRLSPFRDLCMRVHSSSPSPLLQVFGALPALIARVLSVLLFSSSALQRAGRLPLFFSQFYFIFGEFCWVFSFLFPCLVRVSFVHPFTSVQLVASFLSIAGRSLICSFAFLFKSRHEAGIN